MVNLNTRVIHPKDVQFDYFRNSLTQAYSMNVDGSSTTRTYEAFFLASPGHDYQLFNVEFLASGGRIDDPLHFIGLPNALTNGVEIGWYVKDTEGNRSKLPAYEPLKSNYDIISSSSSSRPWGFRTRAKDVLMAEFFEKFTPTFSAYSIIGAYVDIKDDLSDLDEFRMTFRGRIV